MRLAIGEHAAVDKPCLSFSVHPPCTRTVAAGLANILGLIPVMWATGTGADVMRRLAAPMVGGVLSAMLLTLVVIPALYVIWRWQTDIKPHGERAR
jgi:hypothetical protein